MTGLEPFWHGEVMFDIFSFLLAGAVLFHELRQTDWVLLSASTATALAALWCFVRPSSAVRCWVMLTVAVVSYLIEFPFVSNHVVPFLILGCCALFLAAGMAPGHPGARFDKASFYRSLAPVARILLVLVYLFATLAKINSSFFDPRLSAACAISGDVARKLALPFGDWAIPYVIWGTVVVEGGLVVLLVIRRTRMAGVITAIAFHVLMAVAGHIPFSAVALPFLVAFLPDDFPHRLRGLLDRYPRLAEWAVRAAGSASRWVFPVCAAGWLFVCVEKTYGWLVRPKMIENLIYEARLLFYVYLGGLTLVLLLCVARGPRLLYRPGAFRLSHPAFALAPVLLVVNCLCPYLGLKTQVSFTMYSNLQTEGDQWNHLLMPRAMRIFPFQDNLVRIIDSDDPTLRTAAAEGNRWVYFEFHRYVSERPDISVTFEYRGRREEVSRVGDHPVLSRPPGFVSRKLLRFRDVPPPEKNTIRH